MELTYRLSREDHRRFARLACARVMGHAKRVSGWHSRPAVLTLAVVLLGMAFLIYLLFAKLISEFGYFLALCAYLWGALCMWLCIWLTQRWLNKNLLSDNSRSLNEVQLKLVGDGIESSDRVTASRFGWQAFTEVSESGDLVILWLDRAQAVLVPQRAFASEDMRRTFIDTVRGHLPQVPP
jgi:YcxB-like protein